MTLIVAAILSILGGLPPDAHLPPASPQIRAEERLEARAEPPDGRVWWVPTSQKEIALTFDDGPYPFFTPLLLHTLDEQSVPATFFLVGRSVQAYPEITSQIAASGDEIGNHTYNHFKLTELTDDQIAAQLARCGSMLEGYTGAPVALFRPPFGRYDSRVLEIAKQLGYRTILWSDAPDDAPEAGSGPPLVPDAIVKRVVEHAHPGGIVLMHSGELNTVLAIPAIVDALRAQGYRFVTVSQLLSSNADAGDELAGGTPSATR